MDRTSHSKETGLLKEWPKDGPVLVWKIQGLGGGGPSAMQTDPVLSTLDKDKNKKISEDEVSPQRGGGSSQRPRRGLSIMRMMKANSALDADESGSIEESEIKNAVVVFQKLDANRDEKLTEEEAGRKSMGPQNTSAAYSSAIAIDFEGQRQYVQFLGTTVAGVSSADGRIYYRTE